MGVYNHVILLKMSSRQSLISTLWCHGDSSVKRKRPHQEHDTDDSETSKRRPGRKFRMGNTDGLSLQVLIPKW